MLPFFFFWKEGKPVCCSWWWKKIHSTPLWVCVCRGAYSEFFRSEIANVFENAFQWSYFTRIEHTFSIDIVTVNILLNILDCIHSSTLSSVHTKKTTLWYTGTSMKGSLIKKVNWERFFLSERKRGCCGGGRKRKIAFLGVTKSLVSS